MSQAAARWKQDHFDSVWMDNCRPRYSSTGCMNGKLCLKGILGSLIKCLKFISGLEQLPRNVFGIHEEKEDLHS